MLSDSNSGIIRAFGVLNKRYPKGSYAYGVAKPVIFVIDSGGRVTARFSREDYTQRPDIDVILKAIQ